MPTEEHLIAEIKNLLDPKAVGDDIADENHDIVDDFLDEWIEHHDDDLKDQVDLKDGFNELDDVELTDHTYYISPQNFSININVEAKLNSEVNHDLEEDDLKKLFDALTKPENYGSCEQSS